MSKSSSHPAIGTAGRHALFRRWRRRVYLTAGSLAAALFVYSLISIVPNRAAVRLEGEGVSALVASRYTAAERAFNGVLRLEPRSTDARFGLACVFALTGSRGAALIELDLALERGLVLSRSGTCTHGFVFSNGLFVAKFGLANSFVAPLGAPTYQRLLESIPTDTPTDSAQRLLIGACLAFRANLDDVGWWYAANADAQGRITRSTTRRFFNCLGKATRKRLRCGNSLAGCIFTRSVQANYLRDRPKLYPTKATAASG